MALLPRVRGWIDTYCPGTKLALGEYRWGSDGGASSALAHAEALAIYAREGVDAALRWTAPAVGSKVEDAYRLYLDYDGGGGRVTGDVVAASSSDVDAVGAYAVRSSAGQLFVLLFNKDTVARDVAVAATPDLAGPLALYRFDGATALGSAGAATVAAGAFALTLPARSATLVVGSLGLFADGFETGDPGRWSSHVGGP